LTTARARAALPTTLSYAEAAHALGRLAALVMGLATGDDELLRRGFGDRLHVPYRLPLIPGGTEAVAAGLAAGAWAVTVSGAGSGLLAAAPAARCATVAQAMAEAFREASGADGVVAFSLAPDACGVLGGCDHVRADGE
jgi:homoserine kinase